mmetsp:Transcript_19575/g.34935  ORF Transcript_19575/g.34935 Transcript_19575/m.34935 type:complete len:217 (+) Transcript_19575:1100-1750(+)
MTERTSMLPWHVACTIEWRITTCHRCVRSRFSPPLQNEDKGWTIRSAVSSQKATCLQRGTCEGSPRTAPDCGPSRSHQKPLLSPLLLQLCVHPAPETDVTDRNGRPDPAGPRALRSLRRTPRSIFWAECTIPQAESIAPFCPRQRRPSPLAPDRVARQTGRGKVSPYEKAACRCVETKRRRSHRGWPSTSDSPATSLTTPRGKQVGWSFGSLLESE